MLCEAGDHDIDGPIWMLPRDDDLALHPRIGLFTNESDNDDLFTTN